MNEHEALKKYFGYDDFRDGQLDIIHSIREGCNVLAIMPTGAGKSLCYQIPALLAGSFSIVISPLIALMKDQVDKLNTNKIIAGSINSALGYRETQIMLQQAGEGNIKLLYLAPEKLENNEFVNTIRNFKPEYVFVDEAHCISEWGHNFRPSYRKIKDFLNAIEVEKSSAFTATAVPEVRDDIIKELGFKRPRIFSFGFERSNLSLKVIKTSEKKSKLKNLVAGSSDSAIVYCSTRKLTEEVTHYLKINSISAEYYHAGMSGELRQIIQDDFLNNRIQIIVATNAFGMGIDKSDIRKIIHYNLTSSIENYYQEIGRAGRDGNEAQAVLLYEQNDEKIQRFLIQAGYPSLAEVEKVYELICSYGQLAVGSTKTNAISLGKEFQKLLKLNEISIGKFAASLKILEEAQYLCDESKYKNQNFMQFISDIAYVQKFVSKISDYELKDFIISLLKKYGHDIFRRKQKVDLEAISSDLNYTTGRIEHFLDHLAAIGIINFEKPSSGIRVKIIGTRMRTKDLFLSNSNLEKRLEHSKKKLDEIIKYVFTDNCRFKYILEYFGENKENYRCGKCDNCKPEDNLSSDLSSYLEEMILDAIHRIQTPIKEIDLIKLLRGKTKHPSLINSELFGICKHHSDKDIIKTLSELEHRGKILRHNDRLKLSETGIETFTAHSAESKFHSGEEADYEESLELFNRLREIRKIISIKFSQPPAMICPDEVLREISKKKPKSPSEIMSINGFNNRMFNKAGIEFLEVIKEFSSIKENRIKLTKSGLPDSINYLFELIRKRYSFEDIVQLMKLPEAVISMQIESIIKFIPETDISSLITKNEMEIILSKINAGFIDLKSIKNELPSKISYAKIRIALAKFEAINH